MELTGKQRHFLRGLGHDLKPVVHLGKDGLTDAFIAAVAQALLDHELIKVKLGDATEVDRHETAEELALRTGGEIAQVLGHTILLFRARAEAPTIVLP